MKVNDLKQMNEKKNPYFQYYLMAILLAIVFGYLLIFAFEVFLIIGKFMFKYWYAALGILLIIIFFKRRKRKN